MFATNGDFEFATFEFLTAVIFYINEYPPIFEIITNWPVCVQPLMHSGVIRTQVWPRAK